MRNFLEQVPLHRTDDDVDVNDVLTTGGSGTVFLTAGDNAADAINGISLDATVTTAGGDVLLSSANDIVQTWALAGRLSATVSSRRALSTSSYSLLLN